jgi:hypothetical protein
MAAAPGRGSTILSLAGSLLSVRNEVDGCGLWREWCAQQAVSSSPLSPGSPFIDGKLAPTHHGPLTEAAPDFFLRFRPRTKHLSREPVAVHSVLTPRLSLSLSITQSLSLRAKAIAVSHQIVVLVLRRKRAMGGAAGLRCPALSGHGMGADADAVFRVCLRASRRPTPIPSGGGGNGHCACARVVTFRCRVYLFWKRILASSCSKAGLGSGKLFPFAFFLSLMRWADCPVHAGKCMNISTVCMHLA